MATVYFSPIGNGQTFFNTQGQILAGGKIFTYVAGSTTPLATYTDNTGSVQNANPIVLNSAGQSATEVWLTASTKFIIQDSLGNTIQTLDNISPINLIANNAFNEWVSSGLTPTYISTTQFSVVGDQTLVFTTNRRVKATVTAGTVYGSVITASYAVGVTTVTLRMDSGALDGGLSVVSYGFTDPSHTSTQINNLSLTGTVNIGGGTAVASSATLDLTTVTGSVVHVSGTTATSALTMNTGQVIICIADGAWPLTYNASTNNINTNGGNVTLAASDMVVYSKDVGGVVRGWIIKTSGGTPIPLAISSGGTGQTTAAAAVAALAPIQLQTTIATTTGSSVSQTGIPANVKRVTINFNGVSTTGTNFPTVQIGTSGGLQTTGYLSAAQQGAGVQPSTAGFVIYNTTAANGLYGSLTLSLENASNGTWVAAGVVYAGTTTNLVGVCAGVKTLSGTLDRVALITSDVFDAGEISVSWEF